MRVAEPWASRLPSRFGGSGIGLQIVCTSRPRAESKPPNTCGTCCRPAPTSSELAPQYRSCRKYEGRQCTLNWGLHRANETMFARSDRPQGSHNCRFLLRGMHVSTRGISPRIARRFAARHLRTSHDPGSSMVLGAHLGDVLAPWHVRLQLDHHLDA